MMISYVEDDPKSRLLFHHDLDQIKNK